MKDERDQIEAKNQEDKTELIAAHDEKVSELKEEAAKNETLQYKYDDLKASGVVVPNPEIVAARKENSEMSEGENSQVEESTRIEPNQEITKIETVPVATENKSDRPVIVAGPGTSEETRKLIQRIDKLETENMKLEEDKLGLAKAVKNMNEALKEAQRVIKVQEQQINNAERQGQRLFL